MKEVKGAHVYSTDLDVIASGGAMAIAVAVAVNGGDQEPVEYPKYIATVLGLMDLHQLQVGPVFVVVVGVNCLLLSIPSPPDLSGWGMACSCSSTSSLIKLFRRQRRSRAVHVYRPGCLCWFR